MAGIQTSRSIQSGSLNTNSEADQLDGPALSPAPAEWTVLWTRPRQEKEVARFLRSATCSFFLPLIDRVNITNGRKYHSKVPLFPGYIFVSGDRAHAYEAIANKRASRIIPVPDQEQFHRELQQIRRALAEGATLDLYPFAVIGQRCRIKRGPMLGLEGVITDHTRQRTRLILQVGLLGRGAALEVDIDILEPVESADR